MNKSRHKLKGADTGEKGMAVGDSPILFYILFIYIFIYVGHNVTGRSEYIATGEKLAQFTVGCVIYRGAIDSRIFITFSLRTGCGG